MSRLFRQRGQFRKTESVLLDESRLPRKIFFFPKDGSYDLMKTSRLDTRDVMAIRHQT
jgi:hypothetical protein